MVKSVPVKKRWEIVFLATHRLGPKLPINKICKELRCSKGAVQHWLKIYKETGDVEDKPISGRRKITGPKEDTIIKNLSLSNPEATSQEISSVLNTMGITASATTVRRRLSSLGIIYGRPISKPLLSKKQRSERLKFANRNKSRDWTKVLFTDESTFQLHANSEKFWMRRRNRLIVRKVKHPKKIHVWGSFSYTGFGDLVLFEGTLNAIKLLDIYNTGLLPSVNFLFDGDWTLQEDNDPKHTSKIAKKWKEDNLIDRMDWPSNSPDLNPIENLWRIMKVKVRKFHPQNTNQLKKAIKAVWSSLPNNLAQNLVNSMPNRINKILEVKGDSIDY
jgi:transposase